MVVVVVVMILASAPAKNFQTSNLLAFRHMFPACFRSSHFQRHVVSIGVRAEASPSMSGVLYRSHMYRNALSPAAALIPSCSRHRNDILFQLT